MSEYNNFLRHFNKLKNARGSDNSDREDIIPVSDKSTTHPGRLGFDDFSDTQPQEATKKETNTDKKEKIYFASKPEKQETKIEAEKEDTTPPDEGFVNTIDIDDTVEPEPDDEGSDTLPETKFIKTNSTPFISVNDATDAEVPTTVEKYTDRLKPRRPEKRKKTGYTGKINTYDANHSPMAGAPKFITVSEEVKQEARENTSLKHTPEKTAESQTKIIPTVMEKKENTIGEPKVILEKLPENTSSDKTKIINNKGTLLREIAKTSGSLTQEDIDQLTMEGFSGENENDDRESEILEKELSEVREKRINDFNYWSEGQSPTGESEDKSISSSDEKTLPGFLSFFQRQFGHLNTDFVPVDGEEFTDPTKRKEVFSRLISIRKGLIIKTGILGITGIVLLLMNIITSLSAAMNNGFFTVFGSSTVVYNSINLFALLMCGVLMADDLKKGLFSILKLRPKTDSVYLAVFTGALVQNIAAYFTLLKSESDFHLLTSAAVILAVPMLISKIFYCDSTRHCFKAAAATSDKSYLRTISDENMRASLLKDRSNTETNVVYAGKTRFISDFLKKCAGGAFSTQASSKAIAISMAAAIIAFVVSLITSGSMTFATGCFTMCAALAFPISSLVFTGFMLAQENNILSVKSSFISSFSDAHSFCNIDDIVLSGSDIFSAEVTDVTCSRNVAQKQAEFCAAVLTAGTDGILKKAFSRFSEGFEDHFPATEGLIYEDKLGISAWVSDCKVLLGTKDFLINHNVQLPQENSVPFMLGDDIRPLFLAIEGHFAAVFSMKYSCNTLAAKSLSELTYNGANILMGIQDPNLTEEFAEKLLSLPENSLRIIKNDVFESFSAQRNTVTDSENTGIVFTDSFDSFCRTMAGAIKLEKIKKVSKTLSEAGALAGVLFSLVLVFTSSAGTINSWIAVILQLLWIMAGFIITPMIINVPLKTKGGFAENLSQRIRTAPKEKPVREKEVKEPEEAISSDEEDIFDEDDLEGIFSASHAKKNANRRKKPVKIKKEEAQENDARENQEKPSPKSVTAPVFSEHSKPDFRDPAEQLIMQGAPYTKPPEVIDFNKITGDEEYNTGEASKQTVSDDLLDLYAEETPRRRTVSAPSRKSQKKQGLFDRIMTYDSPEDEEDDIFSDISSKKQGTKTIKSFSEEKTPPPPPRYELGKNKKEKENDPLKAKFVPPETDIPTALYNDDYFSSYDTKEDDKTFSDVRRLRKAEEEEDGFWENF